MLNLVYIMYYIIWTCNILSIRFDKKEIFLKKIRKLCYTELFMFYIYKCVHVYFFLCVWRVCLDIYVCRFITVQFLTSPDILIRSLCIFTLSSLLFFRILYLTVFFLTRISISSFFSIGQQSIYIVYIFCNASIAVEYRRDRVIVKNSLLTKNCWK